MLCLGRKIHLCAYHVSISITLISPSNVDTIECSYRREYLHVCVIMSELHMTKKRKEKYIDIISFYPPVYGFSRNVALYESEIKHL